jgi:DNA-binding NarL/FixJ family response regulator
METIRVSIVEDIAEIRNGLAFLINQTPDFTCVSVYDNAEDALEKLPEEAPDIVVMDIGLPHGTGIDCIKKLRSRGCTMQFVCLPFLKKFDVDWHQICRVNGEIVFIH